MSDEPTLMVFGGAFDPPHVGHRLCVQTALKQFARACIMITPTYSPPGLSGVKKQCEASFEDRITLCEREFASEVATHRVTVSRVEATLPVPSYTYQTIESLHRERPQEKLAIVLGFDQLRDFHRWQYPERILTVSSVVVVARGQENPRDILEEKTFKVPGVRITWNADQTVATMSPFGSKIYLLKNERIAVSSSEIRLLREKGQKIPDEWLEKSVRDYMDQKNLYQKDKGAHWIS